MHDRAPHDAAPPKVSICLPTYNRAGYLPGCLGGILAQTLRDFEVIVSDNCSTDATEAVVRSMGDPRIRYVRNERNLGVFPNMNRCLTLARGEYICIIHDDDLYEPRFLEREVAMLDRHPRAAFVHCATYEIDGEGQRRRVVRAYPEDRVIEGRAEFRRYLGGHNVCCSTVMVRGDLYRKMGGFDTDLLCSDWLMWLKLCLEGDVAYVAEPQASLRIHGSALSAGIDAARWCREFLDVVERGLSLAERTCPSILTDRAGLVKEAAASQGRRFFIAAMAALCQGDEAGADGFVHVLHALEGLGLPRAYAWIVQVCRNPVGRLCLQGVRRARRLIAASTLEGKSAS